MELQVLHYPLKILKISGLDPRDNSLFAKISWSVATGALSFMLATSLIEMATKEWSMALIAPVVEGMVASTEVVK